MNRFRRAERLKDHIAELVVFGFFFGDLASFDELRNDRHRASRAIYKVLASAVANALQNPSVRANRLVVSRTFAQDGPPLPGGMRVRPGPQGRAMPIKRRTCHIHIHVADAQANGAGTEGGEE